MPTTELEVLQMARNGIEQIADRYDEAIAKGGTVACRAGCSWCCSLQVTTTAPEVLLLAAYLRATLSADELAAVTARVAELDAVTRGLTDQERAEQRLPCALLVDLRCSGYQARPLMCRGWNSFEAVQCEQLMVWAEMNLPVEYNEHLRNVAIDAQNALKAAVSTVGLVARPLELTAALRITLETPDAGARYTSGEDVFAEARQTPPWIRSVSAERPARLPPGFFD